MDTSNRHLVRKYREAIIFMVPHGDTLLEIRLTQEQSINLAAWLVGVADPDRELFDPALRVICAPPGKPGEEEATA